MRVLPYYIAESDYLETINRVTLNGGEETPSMPDAYLISHDLLEKAYLAGLAVPVEDVAGVMDAAHFPKAALSAVTYHGKLVAYPLLFIALAILMGFRDAHLAVLLTVFGSPIAVSSFTMAQQMGGDDKLAGQLVVFSSLLSVFTMFLFIFGLKELAFF